MNQTFTPKPHPYLILHWHDLESAWRMLASPDKQAMVMETIEALKVTAVTAGPDKALFTLLAATAWLTDDGDASVSGWMG